MVPFMTGVGIVGAGYWSRLVQVPAFQAIPGWDIVGIASGRPQSARALADRIGLPEVFEDYKDLIEDDRVEVVNIATPNHLHREIAVRAMAAGKHVICIKPLAHTLRDAEAMLAAAEKYGRRLFYAENVRFTPALQALDELVREGTYGDVFRTKAIHGVGMPHGSWFLDPELSGGGCIIDMAVHGLAFLDWFSQQAEVSSVFARAANFVSPGSPVEDTSILQLSFADGRLGQTEDSWATPGGFDLRYEVYGSTGHAFVDLMYGHPIRSVIGGNAEARASSVRFDPVDAHFIRDGHRRMMEHFLDVLVDDAPLQSGGLEGFRIMQLVDAAYASVRSGVPQRVSLLHP